MQNSTASLTIREQAIYDKLGDEQSRKFFLLRKLYAENAERGRAELHRASPLRSEFAQLAERVRGKRAAIYGAGIALQMTLPLLREYGIMDSVEVIWDRNEAYHGKKYDAATVTPPPDASADVSVAGFDTYSDRELIIIMMIGHLKSRNEVLVKLRSFGFAEEQLVTFTPIDFDNQYFDEVVTSRFGDAEVFCDVGSFDFVNSTAFLHYCPKAKKIYAFEPNAALIPYLRETAAECGADAEVLPFGLGAETAHLEFHNPGQCGEKWLDHGRMVEGGDGVMDVRALDDVMPINERITFIKADIEGAEMDMLRGASKIIRRDKPKLAISIYHKPQDYVELPEYILSLVPEYKLYIRHYSAAECDTVLYAVMD
jgi:FkbM family methyltransferase